ncbi:Gfo/Idh/MocA family protein [Streptomyces sp. NPDC004059]
MAVGLMGAGRIARVHSAVLRSGVVEGIRLAAVCDVEEERAQKLATAGIPAFNGLSTMVSRCPDIDAVAVLTESGHHAEHALQVLELGRHAIVEKPVDLTNAGVDALAARERADARVAVVHQNRFNTAVVALAAALAQGALGNVVTVAAHVAWGRSEEYYRSGSWRGTRKLDGGTLANQGVHHLDILLRLFGPVAGLHALARRRRHAIECEDTISVLLDFASGAQGVLQVTTATDRDYEGSLTVTGTRGFVRLAGECLNRVDRWEAAVPPPTPEPDPSYSALGIPSLYGYGHVAFYRDFVNCVRTSAPFACTLVEARETVRLLNRIYDSCRVA